MHFVIGGCGRVGSQLANALSAEGHDVVVIDNEEESFRRLGLTFNGLTLVGNTFDVDVLKQARIEEARGFAAVTHLDNTNIMAAEVAKRIFNVPLVIARLYNPERLSTYEKLGLDVICGTTIVASIIRDRLLGRSTHTLANFPSGEVEIVKLKVNEKLVGKKIFEIEEEKVVRVAALERDGTYLIPSSATELKEDDALVVSLSWPEAKEFFKRYMLGEA